MPLPASARLVFLAMLTTASLYGQDHSSAAISDWRSKATVLTKDKPSAIEDARGQFADEMVGLKGYTLEEAAADHVGMSHTEHESESLEELPSNQSDAVVIASFAGYSIHASPSRHSLYTLIKFRIRKIVSDKQKVLRDEGVCSVFLPGGTAILSGGQTLSLGVQGGQTSLIPGHRYLLFLQYFKAEHFYTVVKSWDFTEGKAVPNTSTDRLKQGWSKSSVAGRSEKEVLQALGAK